MFYLIVENFALGFIISAIPGAIFFEVLRRSIIDRPSVILFMAGNFTGMGAIVIASYFGVASLMSNNGVSILFYLLSGLLLMYLGIAGMLMHEKDMVSSKDYRISLLEGSYASGLLLSVANPISILFWISIMGKIATSGGIGPMVGSLSILAGALSFFIILISLAGLISNRLSPKYLVTISRFFGCIIAAYGLATLYAAARQI